MFEDTQTLTGRLGLWPDAMHKQVMQGLPTRLISDLSAAKADIERKDAALRTALSQLVALGGNTTDEYGDKIQAAVIKQITDALEPTD